MVCYLKVFSFECEQVAHGGIYQKKFSRGIRYLDVFISSQKKESQLQLFYKMNQFSDTEVAICRWTYSKSTRNLCLDHKDEAINRSSSARLRH